MNEPPIPPKQERLPKKYIIIEILLCVFAIISAPTLLFPFILVPLAFAYPILIGRAKLLFIPSGIAGAGLLVLLFGDAGLVPWLLVYLAIIAAFGVGAGFIIRRFRKSRKYIKIIATIIGIIVLLVPFLFIVEGLTGLMRSPFVYWRIRTYVARNYADFDLTVGRPSFNFKSNWFSVQVRDSNNPDIYFRITRGGGEIRDGFTGGSFWAGTLNYMLTPLLEDEFGDGFYSFTSSVMGVEAGQPFDMAADVEKSARITVIAESADPEAIAAQILRYYEFVIQSGFSFASYSFRFQYANAPPIRGDERVIEITVLPWLVYDGLPALIKHARDNRNRSGVYVDSGIGFRYVSRVY